MKINPGFAIAFAIVLMASLTTVSSAEARIYASLGGGAGFGSDISNGGAFTDDFTTGTGTTIPGGTVIGSGTGLGWETELGTGYAIFGALGYAMDNGLRFEAEFAYRDNSINSHSGVAVGGGVIDSEDAGVLITGSDNLGVSVGDLVADGQGDVTSWSVMGNLFYDFKTANASIVPYLGVGIGYAEVDSKYAPSGVGILDDKDRGFAFQIMGGIAYALSDTTHLFVGYRYFQADDPTNGVDLIPASLKGEYKTHSVEAGLRFFFN